MKKNEMYFNTHLIKINQESYRSGINFSRFVRFLGSVLLKGESPIEHRPPYARKTRRF